MKNHRPILSQHRLQRLVLWTLTLLHWIASVTAAGPRLPARHRRRGGIALADISHWVGALLMLRALRMLRAPRRARFMYWRAGFNARPSHFRRSLLGARLRRVLKHRDPARHIAQLIAVLRGLDRYAADVARRIRTRLRRILRALLTIAPAAPVVEAPPLAPALADSS